MDQIAKAAVLLGSLVVAVGVAPDCTPASCDEIVIGELREGSVNTVTDTVAFGISPRLW